MTTTTPTHLARSQAGPAASTTAAPADAITLRRRTIDRILTGFGIVATLAFVVAGALLTWGSQFSADYVGDELASQNVTFPTAEELRAEGRDDLVQYAGEDVTTGGQAEAYASYIAGHLDDIADGQTYSQIDDRGARAAVDEARESGASEAEIAELQATADQLTAQRDSLFRGETLRGLLLSAYAWSTVGMIAGYAAIGAFVAAALMAALVIAGIVHLTRQHRTT
jgi:phage terminase Nu1 subunit (DNA packaging protein)